MSSAQQVANSFATEFFERLAKNPADLAELYGHHSTLQINDFEMGLTEAHGAKVSTSIQKWASIVRGSQLRVDSVSASAIHSGVSVFVTMTAVGELQQYFQISTTLEAYTTYNADGYYIRAQTISRVGAVESPAVAPVPVEPAPVAVAPPPARKEEAAPKAKAAKKPPTPPAEEAAKPAAAPEPAPSKPETHAPAHEPAKPAGPKSWASLAGSAARKPIEPGHPIRVVAHEPGAAKKEEAAPAGAAPREAHQRRERRPERPVGERLMFNVNASVTDEEIKAALGPLATSLVSLRNLSDRGRVFMDFAEGAGAFEELHKQPLTVGSAGKVNVYAQRAREEKPQA